MAIVINGSGTVTGLAVGGLPDGTVDAGTLATDSVTAAKIAADSVDSAELIDGAVDDSHIAAMASSKLSGALPAISGASLTGVGIAEADQWRLTTDFQAVTTTIANNLERNDTDFEQIGTGVSHSSGIFSFPSTGKWWILCNSQTDFTQEDFAQFSIETSTNSSTTISTSTGGAEAWYGGDTVGSGYRNGFCQMILDVTNISNMRVRFRAQSDAITRGKSVRNETCFTFIRLGDT